MAFSKTMIFGEPTSSSVEPIHGNGGHVDLHLGKKGFTGNVDMPT